MKSLFALILNLFTRMRITTQFTLLGLTAAAIVAVPFYQFLVRSEADVAFAESERAGIEPALGVIRAMQLVQQHRGLSANVLGGTAGAETDRAGRQADVNGQFTAVATALSPAFADAEVITGQRLESVWNAAQQRWLQVSASVVERRVDARQSNAAHHELVLQLLLVLDAVNDHWKASLDPDAHTYFLAQAALVALPALTEPLGQTRAAGTGFLSNANTERAQGRGDGSGAVTATDRSNLASLLDAAGTTLTAGLLMLEKSAGQQPELAERLNVQRREVQGAVDDLLELAQREIIDRAAPSFDSTEYYDRFTAGIDTVYAAVDVLAGLFGAELTAKIEGLRVIELQEILLAAVTAALGALLGYFILSGVLTSQAATREAIQLESDNLNNSIVSLLQAAGRLAQNDLTVRVPVAEDVTGAVSDSLNAMAESSSKVLGAVVRIANQVAQSARQMKQQAEVVMGNASKERQTVELAANELSKAAQSMLQIAKIAVRCHEAAQKAIATTDRAQGAVQNTVDGIAGIRDTIRETEKRIKRLGERSQEIGGVVNLINTIAERTHILALNASMHAASAGEAGRGFAVVANEVQRLAENAREATAQISGLVNNIQVETADTVVAMNDAISQVVKGTHLAEAAGAEMKDTRATTAELVELVQRIAQGSQAQAKVNEGLRLRAGEIEASTRETYENLESQLGQTELLVDFSEGLRRSISVFRLPEGARVDAAIPALDDSMDLLLQDDRRVANA